MTSACRDTSGRVHHAEQFRVTEERRSNGWRHRRRLKPATRSPVNRSVPENLERTKGNIIGFRISGCLSDSGLQKTITSVPSGKVTPLHTRSHHPPLDLLSSCLYSHLRRGRATGNLYAIEGERPIMSRSGSNNHQPNGNCSELLLSI